MVTTMGNILVRSAAWDLGIQWGCFAIAALLQTEKFYDLAGTGTFALLAYKSLEWGGTYFARQKVQTAMVLIWAVRLGMYLFSRILQDGHDRRFNGVRDNPKVFFIYWTIQAAWVFVTLLPTLIQNSKDKDTKVSTRDVFGWSIWTVGFLIEAISDYQKSQFRSSPDNTGKFINSGLWSISRHPNYFGEILIWLGLYISASSTFKGMDHIGAISPLFITFLLTRVSGIPMLEKSGMRRWGKDPLYQQYVKNTAVLIPWIY